MTAPAPLRTRPAADDHAPNSAPNSAPNGAPSRTAVPIRHTVVLCPAPPVTAPPRPMPAPPVRTVSAQPDVELDRRPIQRDRVLRVVGAMVVTLVVVGTLSWLGQVASAELPAETAVVRVGAGETVWDVAARVAPESDPRAVVQRIRELNGMASSAVQPGQQLQVPDGR